MHLGRFHRVIEMLAQDFRELQYNELIQTIITSLNSVAASPTNPAVATVFKSQVDLCRTTLESSRLNHTRPILRTILESINATNFIGSSLSDRVVAAIASNHAAPALAVQELTKLQEEVALFYQQVVAIEAAFSALAVEYDNLEEGESEIGLLVPRAENASTLKDLSKEFNEWHNALSQIANLFDNSAGPLQIKNCSTTDWMIILAATPPILVGISLCIKGVNTILKDLVATRSLIEQLVAKNGSNAHTDGLLENNKDGFDKGIRSLAEKLVDQHATGVDDGGKNQMKNGINVALKTIAMKINAGTKIELRFIPPSIPETEASIETDADAEIEGGKLANKIDPAKLREIEKLQALSLTLDNEIDLMDFNGMSASITALLESPDMEASSSDASNTE